MFSKQILLLTVLLGCAIENVHPTLHLLRPLVKSVRCKFHQLGSKFIEHEHKHGDPCDNNNNNNINHHEDNHLEASSSTEPQYLNGHSYGPKEPFGQVEEQTSRLSTPSVAFLATSESYPSSLEIDIRFDAQTSSTLRPTYATVPSEGGKHLGKVKCNSGTETEDGCMQEM